MKTSVCRHESLVLAQHRQGALSVDSREHLDTCEACRQALRVEVLLLADAARIPALDQLPDPTLIWWRSRQQDRLKRTERATWPIQVVERMAITLGVLGLLIGLSSAWPVVRSTLDQWSSGWVRGLTQIVPSGEPLWILTLTGSLFLLVGFGLYSQWAER